MQGQNWRAYSRLIHPSIHFPLFIQVWVAVAAGLAESPRRPSQQPCQPAGSWAVCALQVCVCIFKTVNDSLTAQKLLSRIWKWAGVVRILGFLFVIDMSLSKLLPLINKSTVHNTMKFGWIHFCRYVDKSAIIASEFPAHQPQHRLHWIKPANNR